MGFLRYANAAVVRPFVTKTEWQNIRTAGRKAVTKGLNGNLVARATEFFGKDFDPSQYLLTHATIVASVDTYSPIGIKTGSMTENGHRINRKYSDFRVKPECSLFINNNKDCWSRGVILKAYSTFIGANNFLEHVQVEDLSKGRVIDAVARDIGASVYVDILIATDRKHTELIQAIENGKMGTLSMGCSVDETTCTKCGHVAADETELCDCIKYEKGNVFYDDQGNQNIVAELCGHESIDPHGGVLFMDASWVKTPAFTGAVLRNVIEPNDAIARRAQQILSMPPPQWSSDAMLRAAAGPDGVVKTPRFTPGAQVGRTGCLDLCEPTLISWADGKEGSDFLAGWADDTGGGGDAPAEEAPAPAAPGDTGSPFKDVEDSVYKSVMDRVKKRLQDSLAEKPGAETPTPEQSSSTNENLFKQARREVFDAGVEAIVKTASSDIQLLDSLAAFDKRAGLRVPVEMYRTVLKVGSYSRYASVSDYWSKCCAALGRNPTRDEGRMLLRLGKLLSQRQALEQRAVRSRVGGGSIMAVATDKRSKT